MSASLPTESQKLAIVVPMLNEVDNLSTLHDRVVAALEPLGMPFEIVMVDDGSTDETPVRLQEMHARDPRVKVIRLRRNYGQHAATFAGFDYTTCDLIVTLDADLQNDPADIPQLIAKLREGYDVVSGWRTDRHDPWVRRKLPSLIINRFISQRTGLRMHDYGCGLKAYTRQAAKEIAKYGRTDGWYPMLFGWLGFSVGEVEVAHYPREGGKGSRYNLFAQLNQFMSLFTGLATRPFQAVEVLGGLAAALGIIMLAVVVLDALFWHRTNIDLMLMLGTFCTLGGIVIGLLGLLGEYLVRIYYEVRQNPKYLVERITD